MCLFFIIIWLGFPCLKAQPTGTNVNIQLIGPEQGLPNRNSRCIMQDGEGFLWLSTGPELWRYDGYIFQNYTALLTKSIGVNTLINDIQKSPDNKIWIAHNKGISIIDPLTLHCVFVDPSKLFPRKLNTQQTFKIFFEKNENAWLALQGNVLAKINMQLKPLALFASLHKNDSATGENFITNLFSDNQKNLYLYSKNNFLDVINENGRWIKRIDLLNDTLTRKGFVVSSVVASGDDALMIYYEHKADKKSFTRKYFFSTQTFSSITENPYPIIPQNIYADKKGFVWYKSDNEIGYLNNETGSFIVLTNQLQQKSTAQSYFFNALVSSDNTFWLCSKDGLFKINLTKQLFKKYLNVPLQKSTDIGTSTRGITEDSSGNIWVCSYNFIKDGINYSLHKIVPKTGQVQHLKLKTSAGINSTPVLYKIVFVKNYMYAITDGTSFLKIEPHDFTYQTIQFPAGAGNEFSSIYILNDSTLWLGTLSGMAVINTKNLQPVSLNNQNGNYIQNVRVNYFMPWSAHHILASTTNGLYVLNQNATIAVHYANGTKDKIHLPSLSVFYTIWYRNFLWAASSAGLMRIDTSTKKTEIFTMKDGLPDNNIYAALPDENGNLWLSTNNGLCRFNTQTKKVHTYGLTDGLPQMEFNHASFLQSHDGTLYFGGLNGVISFNPSTLDTTEETEAVLHLVSYSKYSAKDNRVETIRYNAEENKIVFNPRDRLFSFSFMSPDYRNIAQNRFRYKLEGWSDDSWHIFENGNKVSFNSLPPGNYTLRVQVSVAGSDWSTKEWHTNIKVTTPWYQTLLFYFLSLIAVAAIVYFFYRNRLKQLMRIQQIRNRISADMHDEIGSTLSSITFYSQALLMQMNETKYKEVVQKIKENAQQVQEGLSDIVWSVKASMDEVENVFTRMLRFGSELLESKNIQFHFESDEALKNKKLDMAERKNFYLIFKEALNNAAKYAECKNIWVKINSENGHIKMIIKDDGKGFNLQQTKQGNGLSNMQQRAAQIKGTLTVSSNENCGTTITLIF